MTAVADITLREQQLDDEGHDENCPVFSDGGCAGPPICEANTAQRAAPRRARSRVIVPAMGSDSVTLTGSSAAAYRRYVAAMAELGAAKDRYAAAGAAAQSAHEEFLRLVVGAAP